MMKINSFSCLNNNINSKAEFKKTVSFSNLKNEQDTVDFKDKTDKKKAVVLKILKSLADFILCSVLWVLAFSVTDRIINRRF